MKKIIPNLFVTLVFCVSAFSQEATKWLEFENPTCEEYLNRMDGVIAEAQNNPSATIYIFVYEGKETVYNSRKQKMELKFPTVGLAKVKIDSMKKFMKIRVPSIKNITFIEAGLRENLTVEMRIVPNGATPPKPSPTLEKIRHRKGSATGFCLCFECEQ